MDSNNGEKEVTETVAGQYLKQAEDRDIGCGLLFLSALLELMDKSPDMTVNDVFIFASLSMPRASKAHSEQ